MKKKHIIVLSVSLGLTLLIFQYPIKRLYYNFQEYSTLKRNIIWSPKTKLKISDFKFRPNETYIDNFSARVGIVSVHNIKDKINLRSTTIFLPKDSYVTDTTNHLFLRIAQARFDLCEIYRRRLELKIDSLNRKNVDKITKDSIFKLEEFYYNKFEREWDVFNETKKKQSNVKNKNVGKLY